MTRCPRLALSALLLTAAATLAVAPAFGSAPPAAPSVKSKPRNATVSPPESPRALAAAAREAMQAGDYGRAIEHYDRLRDLAPDRAEIPYDMGVAAYRAGDLDRASQLFDQALTLADDPALRASAAYNLATTSYRRALDDSRRPPSPPGAAPPDAGPPGSESPGRGDDAPPSPVERATGELERALGHFREALDADPTDQDARVNAQLANELLRRLAEMQEQQQQQQQQQQESDDEQGDDQDQQQPQQQQQQEDGQQDENPTEQERGEQQQQQQQQQGDDEQQPQPQEPQPGEQGEEDESQSPPQPQPADDEQDAQNEPPPEQGEPREDGMSREQAERLLQSVRDKERRRREDLARAEAARRAPVDKDW